MTLSWRDAVDAGRARVTAWLPKPLTHVVERDHWQTDAEFRHRRRVVSGVSVAGGALLGVSLSTRPGSKEFYGLTMGVAGVWAGGAMYSGPLHLGWIESLDARLRRPVLVPVGTGVLAFGAFYSAALVAREVPVLRDAVASILQFADRGSSPLVLLTTCANGIAEEVFFRGALYAAVGQDHPVAKSTVAYTLVTAATRNPALVIAGAVMGMLFGYQRRASGGIQAPILTHVTWSVLMLRYVPPLFRDLAARRAEARP